MYISLQETTLLGDEGSLTLQVSHDGGAKPLTIGVRVHKNAKMTELLDAVKQYPAASCNPGEELVMAYCAGTEKPFTETFMIHDMSTETHDHQTKHGCRPA